MTPKQVVIEFWNAMKSNDFVKASEWLSEDFKGFWPQSSELIVGRDNFIAINTFYPANGKWLFEIKSILAEKDSVVTDVVITDGVVLVRAITFHTVVNDLISKQVEYWPEDYEAPAWRAKWVKIESISSEIDLK